MLDRFAVAILAAIPFAAVAGSAGAADIKVLAAGAVEEPFRHLAADFAKESGNKVEASYGSVGAMQAKLKAGEKPDVIVLSVAAMDELDKAGTLVSASRAELGRAVAGLAVKAGAKEPDISTQDAFKKTLLTAAKVAYTDPAAGGTTGIYLTGLLQRLGVTEEIKKKALLESGGSAVAAAVAKGDAEIGITFISELLPNKGVKVVGPIPQPIGLIVGYVAAVSTASSQAEPARALIAYMTRPAAHNTFKEAGL
jgi:molybdate transport system substrate-binding protein